VGWPTHPLHRQEWQFSATYHKKWLFSAVFQHIVELRQNARQIESLGSYTGPCLKPLANWYGVSLPTAIHRLQTISPGSLVAKVVYPVPLAWSMPTLPLDIYALRKNGP